MTPPITKDSIPAIRQLIEEYEAHDREAFETRTELFKMMFAMCQKLEETL